MRCVSETEIRNIWSWLCTAREYPGPRGEQLIQKCGNKWIWFPPCCQAVFTAIIKLQTWLITVPANTHVRTYAKYQCTFVCTAFRWESVALFNIKKYDVISYGKFDRIRLMKSNEFLLSISPFAISLSSERTRPSSLHSRRSSRARISYPFSPIIYPPSCLPRFNIGYILKLAR